MFFRALFHNLATWMVVIKKILCYDIMWFHVLTCRMQIRTTAKAVNTKRGFEF